MKDAEIESSPAAEDMFKRASRLHRRKRYEDAAALYEAIIEQDAQVPLARRARKRLLLVAKNKRPTGRAGFLALSGVIWGPALAFLFGTVLPRGSETYALLVLALIPVLALWSLFQPGGWNRAAGYLTIAALVAALAIPQNVDYTGRARVSEGLGLGAAAKTAVADFYGEHGRFPASNEEAALAPPAEFTGSSVRSLSVGAGGVITITYQAAPVAGQTLILKPHVGSAGMVWSCTGGSVKAKYRPVSCR